MLDIKGSQGQHYIVMGLGRSGLSTCAALQAAGAVVTVWDDKPQSRQEAETLGFTVIDPLSYSWQNIAALVLSPGIPHTFPAPHPVAEQAQAANVPIICDIELLLKSQAHAAFIGISGTNGKSTTTALIGHILQSANHPVAVGGNIGIPVCNLPSFKQEGTYVLELSSYHLERVPSLNLDVAVLTNITEDHLTRHGGMEGYIKAKKRLFIAQKDLQHAIVSIDDRYCQQIVAELAPSKRHKLIPISVHQQVKGGVYIQDGWLYDEAFTSHNHKLFSLHEINSLRGHHNWQNILHAYAAARARGVPVEVIVQALHSFKNLPHRLESLGVIAGVEFINDSKGTNAESTRHALAACDDIYWILGGVAKESELQGLDVFYPKVRHAFTIGQASERFAELLAGQVPVTKCFELSKAVETAFGHAHKAGSGTVLLSPVCASFDQFKDFEDRGEAFREMVKGLQQQQGS